MAGGDEARVGHALLRRRHRRRLRLDTDTSEPLLLDLPQAMVLHEGDGLVLEDGQGWIEVHAAPEPLVEITAPDPLLLLRLARHLGNRHLAVQIEEARLKIRPDHVIAGMVRRLGGRVREIEAPFTSEGGAYAGHDYNHGHAPGNRHDGPAPWARPRFTG